MARARRNEGSEDGGRCGGKEASVRHLGILACIVWSLKHLGVTLSARRQLSRQFNNFKITLSIIQIRNYNNSYRFRILTTFCI